jgi:hypothetical protein
MAERLTEAVGPGVDMRVELDERQRSPEAAAQRAQQRQRGAMIAAERQRIARLIDRTAWR